MVTFIDNSTLAQLCPNDMRNAIAHTLNYQKRKKSDTRFGFNFTKTFIF